MDGESTTEPVNKFKGRFTEEGAEAMQTLVAPIAKTLEGISFKRASGRVDRGFDSAPSPAAQETKEPAPPPRSPTLPQGVEDLEQRMIEEAFLKSGGNKQKATQALGLSRQDLI